MRTIAMLAMALAVTACGSMSTAQASESPASPSEQRSYTDVRGSDRVSVLGPHQGRRVVGRSFSVRAEGPSKTLERTEDVAKVDDGELKDPAAQGPAGRTSGATTKRLRSKSRCRASLRRAWPARAL